ncbi:unnamed protein product [Porites lobata]|uniref:Uncharacterized protein n=1 Tax=Porites lobata TaxID=104759 RepID=A0ABN8PBG3_9CNID|nr:unnamed protein product [Porites lobata]
MHILIHHVPHMLRRHGSLKMFSGQGVEKKNDDFRRYFYTKINRWDSAKDLLIGGKTAGSTQGLRESKQRLREKEGVVLDGERKAAGSKESCQSNSPIPPHQISSTTKSAVHFSRTKENESNRASCSTVSTRESIQQKDKEASINKCVFRWHFKHT